MKEGDEDEIYHEMYVHLYYGYGQIFRKLENSNGRNLILDLLSL